MKVKDRKRRRLVRLGVIRLGHKEKRKASDGREYEFPVQDDHFLLHDAPEVEEFYRRKGVTEVRELDVLLPFPDIERNFSTAYEVWAGGILVCQGDGEYVTYAGPFTCTVTEKGRTSVRNAPGDTVVSNGVARVAFDWGESHFGEGEYVPCPGANADLYPHCAACKLSGVLKVMMADPDLFRFGYYQISTGSGRNFDTIMGTLEMIPAGQLNGFPYKLRLVEGSTSYTDENGQRRATTRYFLELEPDPAIVRELYRRQTERMLGHGEERRALPEHIEDDDIWDPGDVEPPAPPPYAEVQKPHEPVVVEGDPVEEPQVKTRSVSFTTAVLEAVVKGGHAEDKPAAMALLNCSDKLSRNDPEDIVLRWCQFYRGARGGGDSHDAAAQYADEKTFEGLE